MKPHQAETFDLAFILLSESQSTFKVDLLVSMDRREDEEELESSPASMGTEAGDVRFPKVML